MKTHLPARKTYTTPFKILAAGSVLLVALYLRLILFNTIGGDHETFKQAAINFASGRSPYKHAIRSFAVEGMDHGYAYFPTLLYILTLMWQINAITPFEIPTAILFKIPVLLADIGVAVLLLKYFVKKSPWVGIFAATLWLLNPYFMIRFEYTLFDPIQVFLMLLGLQLVGKKDFLAGLFYGLALSIKLIPVILFPIFLIKATKRLKIVAAIGLVFVAISLPFILSRENLATYLTATVFVHGERNIQGKPFLTFISYYLQDYGIDFYQHKFTQLYSAAALCIGPIVTSWLLYTRKVRNKYILGMISFALYYLLTPIFGRTHFLWGYPLFLIGLYEVFSRHPLKYYVVTCVVYAFMAGYIYIWYKGYKAPTVPNGRIWIDDIDSLEYKLPIIPAVKNKFYEYRDRLN